MQVASTLKPAVETGALRGQSAAMATVTSWGSKDRRTREDLGGGGLYWSTYFATVRHRERSRGP